MKFIRKVIVVGVLILATTISVCAHPFYYDSDYGYVEISWDNMRGSKYYLEVNGDYLDSSQAAYYAASSEIWETNDNKAYIRVDTECDYSDSTVDFCTPTESWWERNTTDAEPYGMTILSTTNGAEIDADVSYAIISNSSCLIDYAQIYMDPELTSVDQIKKTMTHEIGHVWGFGHTNRIHDPLESSVSSIMRSGRYEGYWEPQAHDYADLEEKYGG